MAGQQRGRGAAQPSEEKCPPAFRAEVVFGFDYYRVEYPYHQECGYAYNQTCEIHFGNFLGCKYSAKASKHRRPLVHEISIIPESAPPLFRLAHVFNHRRPSLLPYRRCLRAFTGIRYNEAILTFRETAMSFGHLG